ncbi:MAG: hypothetical protein COV91_03735 [Candidatus Taylorbacteria bacterium CG11_big_fil_rev_8_21_14_0_20_46_11]|uniref:Band 7 domain-containing protein n=1 Tax=Candidatus Taylorbacteria bacterium CG11_big_fil_rev_8_21_14_0_20_46_11 TaxID=1975025 RepID=A0A2H0KBC7_9BACT|nr:MAG: hypothetical protein COV91_03735 [Candidatus Taylorbacteria bacterium CG11_big_fil_rev_8_21_14_0_20_46_11]
MKEIIGLAIVLAVAGIVAIWSTTVALGIAGVTALVVIGYFVVVAFKRFAPGAGLSGSEDIILEPVEPFYLRWSLALLVWSSLLLVSWLLAYTMLGMLGVETFRLKLSNQIGGGLGVAFIATTIPLLFRFNGLYQGFLAINLRTGTVHLYTKGIHLLSIWTVVRKEDRFSYKATSVHFEFEAPCVGGKFHVHGSALIAPRVNEILNFVKIGDTDHYRFEVIAGSVSDQIEGRVSELIGSLDPDTVQETLPTVRTEAEHRYRSNASHLEDTYGVDIKQVHFSLDPDAGIEASRAKRYEATQVTRMAEEFQNIDPAARQDALTVAGKNPRKHDIAEHRVVLDMPSEVQDILLDALKDPEFRKTIGPAVTVWAAAKGGASGGGKSKGTRKGGR